MYFNLMHPVMLEYEYAVNRQTIKTQLYKTMIYSATCFDPMGSSSGWYLNLLRKYTHHIKERRSLFLQSSFWILSSGSMKLNTITL